MPSMRSKDSPDEVGAENEARLSPSGRTWSFGLGAPRRVETFPAVGTTLRAGNLANHAVVLFGATVEIHHPVMMPVARTIGLSAHATSCVDSALPRGSEARFRREVPPLPPSNHARGNCQVRAEWHEAR